MTLEELKAELSVAADALDEAANLLEGNYLDLAEKIRAYAQRARDAGASE